MTTTESTATLASLRALLRQPGMARWSALATLCTGEVDYTTQVSINKVIERTMEEAKAPFPTVRVALLGSHTVEHLVPAIRVASLARGFLVEVYVGEYGQYRQALLQPAQELVDFAADILILSVSARPLVDSISPQLSESEVLDRVRAFVAELNTCWRQARDILSATIFQQTCLDTSDTLFGSLDRSLIATPAAVVDEVNRQIRVQAPQNGIAVLDVDARSRRDGLCHWLDTERWLQGKLEIAPAATPSFGRMTAALIAAQRGASAKCLVLDLDNTLWGGVIGDDGLEGIVLGEGSAEGEAYLHIQRYAKLLRARGVALAVCSKNEDAVARQVFELHPEMVLRLDDIAVFIANWDDKSVNIRAIAERLNIGLDALVFLDDNPAERQRVRESLPQVQVPELGSDPSRYVEALTAQRYFEALAFTTEDGLRADAMKNNAARVELASSAQTMEEFLASLEMRMEWGVVGPIQLARAIQLLNKTNQFNTAAARYSQVQIQNYCDESGKDGYFFRLLDRFGDNGIVSIVLTTIDSIDQSLSIDNWVMSCRVFGRQLENEVMNRLVGIAKDRNFKTIKLNFKQTERNEVARKTLMDFGFKASSSEDFLIVDPNDLEHFDTAIAVEEAV